MSIWTAQEAAIATGGETQGEWSASRVIIDSRVAQEGDLFVALQGERADGHEFAGAALNAGAAAAMVSHIPERVPRDKLLMVPNVMQGLQHLGLAGRARFGGKVIGLTGSVGKTSTKEMLKLMLESQGETFASAGNLNNHIGVPLNLSNVPPTAQFAVLEMGMNHAGEIAALTQQVRPHVALITNVEAVHLEFFPNVEAIADAKAEILQGLQHGGTAVLYRDSPYFACLAAQTKEKIISFGVNADSGCRLLSYTATAQGSRMEADIFGKKIRYTTATVGRHWATTSLSALAVACALKLDVAACAASLASFTEVAGRGKLTPIPVNGGTAILMDDSYNASPASMRAAFAKMAELPCKGRKIAALGEMRELGETAPALHASLADDLAKSGIKHVFTACPLMQHLHDALPAAIRADHTPDAAALLPILQHFLIDGDLLLIKGSHGSLMYQVAEALQNDK